MQVVVKRDKPELVAADVLAASDQAPRAPAFAEFDPTAEQAAAIDNGAGSPALSNIWRIMAERTAQSWTTIPHFYLVREVNASWLMAWREQLLKRPGDKSPMSRSVGARLSC